MDLRRQNNICQICKLKFHQKYTCDSYTATYKFEVHTEITLSNVLEFKLIRFSIYLMNEPEILLPK